MTMAIFCTSTRHGDARQSPDILLIILVTLCNVIDYAYVLGLRGKEHLIPWLFAIGTWQYLAALKRPSLMPRCSTSETKKKKKLTRVNRPKENKRVPIIVFNKILILEWLDVAKDPTYLLWRWKVCPGSKIRHDKQIRGSRMLIRACSRGNQPPEAIC